MKYTLKKLINYKLNRWNNSLIKNEHQKKYLITNAKLIAWEIEPDTFSKGDILNKYFRNKNNEIKFINTFGNFIRGTYYKLSLNKYNKNKKTYINIGDKYDKFN